MPQVDTNGIKIEYRFDGKEGAPYITFVTGIANDLTMWDTQVEALGKDYRTLRYDLRGHGDTLATEGDYTMDCWSRDLVGLLDELNIRRPISWALAWAARSCSASRSSVRSA